MLKLLLFLPSVAGVFFVFGSDYPNTFKFISFLHFYLKNIQNIVYPLFAVLISSSIVVYFLRYKKISDFFIFQIILNIAYIGVWAVYALIEDYFQNLNEIFLSFNWTFFYLMKYFLFTFFFLGLHFFMALPFRLFLKNK